MKRLLPLVLLPVVALAACKKSPPAATQPAAAGAAATAAQPAQTPTKPVPDTLPEVVARVNGEPIAKWEVENAVKRVEQRAGSAVPADKRSEVIRSVLDQLVAFHALSAEARQRKLAVTDADVQTRIDMIRKNFPTEESFKQGLASQGMTLDQMKTQTRMSIEIQKVIETEIDAKVNVSDADVDAFYKQNAERFKQEESVQASHILVAVPQTADAAEKQKAKTKAEQLLKQVKSGADFATVARKESQDPGSAPNGGDLGFFAKGQMTPKFEEAAFGLKDGAVSGIVETPFGFHIIKTIARRPARTVPLTEAKPQIHDYLLQEQRQSKLEQFIDQTKAKMKIEVLV